MDYAKKLAEEFSVKELHAQNIISDNADVIAGAG